MLHVLGRRFPGLHVRLFPAQVQGEGASDQIVSAIAYFNRAQWADVLIVARGGGSLEDLWAFNEEPVARAIAASKIPLISAIGHETDFTISDFVADLRAPTPSAAAEIVICTRESLFEQITTARTKLVQSARYRLARSRSDLHRQAVDRAGSLVHRAITKRVQRVDDLDFTLRSSQRKQFDLCRNALLKLQSRLRATDVRLRLATDRRTEQSLRERLLKCAESELWRKRRRWEVLHLHLTQLSPLTILARGYAIVRGIDGHVLRSSSETSPGDSIDVRLHEGRISAVVRDNH
jgi:exodeoxyribonuclease VII large subunit